MSSYYRSSSPKKRRFPLEYLTYGGESTRKPRFNFSFHFDAPSNLKIRISHYGKDVYLHFTKGERYLCLKESEFYDMISKHDEIEKKIEKCHRFILKGGKRMKKGEEDSFKVIKKSEKSAKLELENKKREEESESSSAEESEADNS